jgi:formate-dependent phosphoribosylglycinamide formyltransferase (GAR transformylase)
MTHVRRLRGHVEPFATVRSLNSAVVTKEVPNLIVLQSEAIPMDKLRDLLGQGAQTC